MIFSVKWTVYCSSVSSLFLFFDKNERLIFIMKLLFHVLTLFSELDSFFVRRNIAIARVSNSDLGHFFSFSYLYILPQRIILSIFGSFPNFFPLDCIVTFFSLFLKIPRN